jgi:hypothetical protein
VAVLRLLTTAGAVIALDRIGDFLRDNLPGDNAQRFVRAFQKAYDAVYNGLREDQEAHIEYHSPAGEIVRLGRLNLDPNVHTWVLDGQSKHTGEWCRVFAPVSAAHLVLRVVTVEEGEPERRRIGFTVTEEETGP